MIRRIIPFLVLFLSVNTYAFMTSQGTNYIKGAVAAYYMNSAGDATETDVSGNSATLTESASDTIAQSADNPTNWSGYSKDFESTETEWLESADGGSTDINGADQPISISVWIKPEDDTADDMYIVSKWDNVNGYRQYALKYDESSAAFMCLISNNGTDYSTATGATDISYGAWQHIACVYNDTDIRIYVNGALDSNGADNPKAHATGIFDGGEAFRIGAEDADKYYDGLIDDVVIDNIAYTAAQITEIYRYGIDGHRGLSD